MEGSQLTPGIQAEQSGTQTTTPASFSSTGDTAPPGSGTSCPSGSGTTSRSHRITVVWHGLWRLSSETSGRRVSASAPSPHRDQTNSIIYRDTASDACMPLPCSGHEFRRIYVAAKGDRSRTRPPTRLNTNGNGTVRSMSPPRRHVPPTAPKRSYS